MKDRIKNKIESYAIYDWMFEDERLETLLEKMIYAVIFSRGVDGFCESHEVLAAHCKTTSRTTKRVTKKLIEKGLIIKTERFYPDGGQMTNKFEIDIDAANFKFETV